MRVDNSGIHCFQMECEVPMSSVWCLVVWCLHDLAIINRLPLPKVMLPKVPLVNETKRCGYFLAEILNATRIRLISC